MQLPETNPPVISTPAPAAAAPVISPAPADPLAAPVDPPAEDPPIEPDTPAAPPDDPFLELILRDLPLSDGTLLPGIKPAVEPTDEPLAPPVDTPPVTPVAPVTPPAPAPAKIKTSVKSTARGNPLVDSAPAIPQFTPPPPLSPVVVPDNLTEEQREELQEAEVAARLFPDKYGARVTELRAYYIRAEALRTAKPNVAEDDEDFQALVQSKPDLKPVDARKVQRKIGEDIAVQATEKRLQPKINKIEMDAKRAAILPEVKSFVAGAWTEGVRNQIKADTKSVLAEPLRLGLEKGFDAASAEFPLETRVMRSVADKARAKVTEFLLMRNNAVDFDASNPVHNEVSQFINFEGQQFQKTGGKYLVRDGRQFMPRSQFIAMVGNDQAEGRTLDAANWRTAKYWTFDDVSIVDMMGIRMKEEAEFYVKNASEQAKRDGFTPAPKKGVASNQPNQPKAPAELAPPKAGQRPSPGAQIPAAPLVPADDSPIPLAGILANLKIVK